MENGDETGWNCSKGFAFAPSSAQPRCDEKSEAQVDAWVGACTCTYLRACAFQVKKIRRVFSGKLQRINGKLPASPDRKKLDSQARKFHVTRATNYPPV